MPLPEARAKLGMLAEALALDHRGRSDRARVLAWAPLHVRVLALLVPAALVDQPEIVLGVLVVVLGRDRIAGGAGVAGELDVFLGNMRSGTADLDIGAVGFEHPGHRVLAAPVVVVVIAAVIPIAQPLVVLPVSHVLPFQPTPKVRSAKLRKRSPKPTSPG